QAEDGIRDRNVTGVQTCALPICAQGSHVFEDPVVISVDDVQVAGAVDRQRDRLIEALGGKAADRRRRVVRRAAREVRLAEDDAQIGRASCRERVWGWGGGGGVEE